MPLAPRPSVDDREPSVASEREQLLVPACAPDDVIDVATMDPRGRAHAHGRGCTTTSRSRSGSHAGSQARHPCLVFGVLIGAILVVGATIFTANKYYGGRAAAAAGGAPRPTPPPSPRRCPVNATLSIDGDLSSSTTSATMVSFNLDWHENKESISDEWNNMSAMSISLDAPLLRAAARAVSPAVLRIGGSEGDVVCYDEPLWALRSAPMLTFVCSLFLKKDLVPAWQPVSQLQCQAMRRI